MAAAANAGIMKGDPGNLKRRIEIGCFILGNCGAITMKLGVHSQGSIACAVCYLFRNQGRNHAAMADNGITTSDLDI